MEIGVFEVLGCQLSSGFSPPTLNSISCLHTGKTTSVFCYSGRWHSLQGSPATGNDQQGAVSKKKPSFLWSIEQNWDALEVDENRAQSRDQAAKKQKQMSKPDKATESFIQMQHQPRREMNFTAWNSLTAHHNTNWSCCYSVHWIVHGLLFPDQKENCWNPDSSFVQKCKWIIEICASRGLRSPPLAQ